MSESRVTLEVSHDVALVLFDWLAERQEQDIAAHPNAETPLPAEEIALDHLHGALERTLAEVLDPAYHRLLSAAKARLQSAS